MAIPRPVTVEDRSDSDHNTNPSDNIPRTSVVAPKARSLDRSGAKDKDMSTSLQRGRLSNRTRYGQGGDSMRYEPSDGNARSQSQPHQSSDHLLRPEQNRVKPVTQIVRSILRQPVAKNSSQIVQANSSRKVDRNGMPEKRIKKENHNAGTDGAKEEAQHGVQLRFRNRRTYHIASSALDEAWKPIKEKKQPRAIDLAVFFALSLIVALFCRHFIGTTSVPPAKIASASSSLLLNLADEEKQQQRDEWLAGCVILSPTLYEEDVIDDDDRLKAILTVNQAHVQDLRSALVNVHHIAAHLVTIEWLLLQADTTLRPAIAALRKEHVPARHRWVSSRQTPSVLGDDRTETQAIDQLLADWQTGKAKLGAFSYQQLHNTCLRLSLDFLDLTGSLRKYHTTLSAALLDLHHDPNQKYQSSLRRAGAWILKSLWQQIRHQEHPDPTSDTTNPPHPTLPASLPASLNAASSACGLSIREPWTLAMKHTWLRRRRRLVDWLIGHTTNSRIISPCDKHSDKSSILGSQNKNAMYAGDTKSSVDTRAENKALQAYSGGQAIDTLTSRVAQIRDEVRERARSGVGDIEEAARRVAAVEKAMRRVGDMSISGRDISVGIDAGTEEKNGEGRCEYCQANTGKDDNVVRAHDNSMQAPAPEMYSSSPDGSERDLDLEQRIITGLGTLYADLTASMHDILLNLGDLEVDKVKVETEGRDGAAHRSRGRDHGDADTDARSENMINVNDDGKDETGKEQEVPRETQARRWSWWWL